MAAQNLGYQQLTQIAVAQGATTPNPGSTGVLAWSTTLAAAVVWNGTRWVSVSPSSHIATLRPRDLYPDPTNFQSLDTRNGWALLDADGGSTNEIVRGVFVLPEGLDYSGGIITTGWVAATTATSGNFRYGVRFMRMNTDIDTDSFGSAVEAQAATSATSGILTPLALTNTDVDGAVAGDALGFEWYRDASDTSNDTVSGDTETLILSFRTAS
ncbi:MAG: hypothetical protein ACT4QA_22660 [Panacagrimonas sp.]